MPPIFINTDNSDPKDKLYNASKAGATSADLEKKMQDMVIKVIEKDSTFTTNKIKDAKGYSIRLKVAKLETNGGETSCSLAGEIIEYPKITYSKAGNGEKMLSTGMRGSARATGRSAAIDCVESITEDLVKKAIPIMRTDMASNR